MGILICSLIGGGFWMRDWSKAREERLIRPMLSGASDRSADDLADCLADHIALTSKRWKRTGASEDTLQAENAARHLLIEIEELGNERIVTLLGRQGRLPRQNDREALAVCL